MTVYQIIFAIRRFALFSVSALILSLTLTPTTKAKPQADTCVGRSQEACAPASKADFKADGNEISQNDLIKLGLNALQYKRSDAFSPPFNDSAALAHTFVIRIPLRSNIIPNMPEQNGGWTYDSDKNQLTVTVGENGWLAYHHSSGSFPFTIIEGIEIFNNVRHIGRELEHNAFGSQVVVNFSRMRSIGVAPISHDAISNSVNFDKDWNTLFAHIKMPPNKAREFTKNAIVVVRGKIVPLDNGMASLCDFDGASASYTSPTSVSEKFCVFNAEIQRVAIESNGELVAEWNRSEQAERGSFNDASDLKRGERPASDSQVLPPSAPTGGPAGLTAGAAAVAKRGGIGIGYVPSPVGAIVMVVAPGSKAAAAGLKPGETIEAVNGVSIRGMDQTTVTAMLHAANPTLTLKVVGVGDVVIKH